MSRYAALFAWLLVFLATAQVDAIKVCPCTLPKPTGNCHNTWTCCKHGSNETFAWTCYQKDDGIAYTCDSDCP